MTYLQAVLIAVGSSLLASALILQRYQAIAIAIPMGMFLVFFVGLHLAARQVLPRRPLLATRLIGTQWLGLVGLAVLAGGVPLWLAALLPKDVTGAAQSGMTVVAVVIGLALVEVLKKLAVDQAIIESAGEKEWQKLFMAAYAPMFEGGQLPRERTVVNSVTGKSIVTKTYAWQAIYAPPVHGGFGREGRVGRAGDLEDALVEAGLKSTPSGR